MLISRCNYENVTQGKDRINLDFYCRKQVDIVLVYIHKTFSQLLGNIY